VSRLAGSSLPTGSQVVPRSKRVAPGESRHPELRGVERHGDGMPEEFNELETMVLEATRP
jgi:hypothetical protein